MIMRIRRLILSFSQRKLERMAEIYSKELVEVLAVMVKMDVSCEAGFWGAGERVDGDDEGGGAKR
jgi:hypothetical protein